jgi:hypothetical protein
MNTLQNLNTLPFSKVEQSNFVTQVVAEILEGNINPLDADLKLKAMENAIIEIRKNSGVKEYVISEAEKYGKTFEHSGVTITVTQKTVKDFTGCDQVLDELYLNLELTKAQIKAREAMVLVGINPATGEVFAPPKTSTTRYLTYKFK